MNFLLTIVFATTIAAAGKGTAAARISVDSVFLTLLEEVEVPAREAGIIEELLLREGQAVKEGQLLARIDDTRSRLACEQARIELERARKLAANDFKVQLAGKTQQVAGLELQRALDSYQRVAKSVSKTELDRLRLAAEGAELEIEQASFEYENAQLTLHAKENELLIARHDLERRQITAPISGLVVEVKRSRGEWVQPGQTVLRVVRIDRLRAEGLLPASDLTGDLIGRRVELTVSVGRDRSEQFDGVVTFVSPEVNPVNGQVRIWADIDNRASLLRPGLRARMIISP